MTEEEDVFVDTMGRFLATYGMTPMAGRLWGYLLICDPPEQTAEQIARALHASRGAISGTVRLLEPIGFVRRTRRRGDRREYLSAPPGTSRTWVENAGGIYRRLRLILEEGLAALKDKPPPLRARLEEAHEFIAYVEREIPTVLDRFVSERASATEPASAATEERIS
ncbi:MAG TPA: MarR family transcriptional regulator [candidate division Zixibacteria bacterium]|nr:MarR family transcriptional regulator [candidate division Zixibacteria bacterium]